MPHHSPSVPMLVDPVSNCLSSKLYVVIFIICLKLSLLLCLISFLFCFSCPVVFLGRPVRCLLSVSSWSLNFLNPSVEDERLSLISTCTCRAAFFLPTNDNQPCLQSPPSFLSHFPTCKLIVNQENF